MRVDPAADEQLVRVAVVKERVVAGFGRVAGVRGAVLFREDEVRDEESVADEGAAEDGTGFEVARCVCVGEVHEVFAEVWREEEGAERGAGLGVGGWFEGIF